MPAMLSRRLVLLPVFMLLCCSSAALAQQGNVREAIEEGSKQWSAALSRGDSAGIAALYTPNAQLFPTHSDIVRGVAAIQKFWQGMITSGVKGMTRTTLEVDEQGDTAYEVGKYRLIGKGDKVRDNGKYVAVWKREQGRWQLHRDIGNSSVPASGH